MRLWSAAHAVDDLYQGLVPVHPQHSPAHLSRSLPAVSGLEYGLPDRGKMS
jgi:hypothetical protein